jgi:glutathione peroxidase
MIKEIYIFEAQTIDGKTKKLSDYKGKTLLIVNTASLCGFTKQYAGLQEIYEKYNSKGFEILAFPCNQFLNQEPGTNLEISNFCKTNYGVSFPIFAKVDVNGQNAHPLFQFLSEATPGLFGSKLIKWNFTKFLVDKNGVPMKRFSPMTTPAEIETEIARMLEQPI